MKATEFNLLDLIAEAINSEFEKLLKAGEFDGIKRTMKEAIDKLPDSYSLNFNIELSVSDTNREKSIKLLQTGLTTSGDEPYQVSLDKTCEQYWVDGETCIVPEEVCPNCWGDWTFKFKQNKCGHCNYELGKQVKYFLDDYICPMCQEGEMTVNKPVCDKCGYEVESDKVVWG
jgi:hypothetical protein